jgi:hypothetical protein
VVNTVSGTVLARVPVGYDPRAVALNSSGTRA